MVRSVYGMGLAGKIKTYLVFDVLSQRCVLHMRVQLLLSSRESGTEPQAGDRRSGAVSICRIFKAKSQAELRKG